MGKQIPKLIGCPWLQKREQSSLETSACRAEFEAGDQNHNTMMGAGAGASPRLTEKIGAACSTQKGASQELWSAAFQWRTMRI